MTKLFANRPFAGMLAALLFWLLLYAALWYLLTGGSGWAFGVPSVCLASFLAVYLRIDPWWIRIQHLPLFLIFFLRSAFSGAVDVARRSIDVRRRITPAWVRYRFNVADPRVRLLVSAIIGLFPGTLASKIEADELHVHILDETVDWRATVAQLEFKLAQLLSPSPGEAGKK